MVVNGFLTLSTMFPTLQREIERLYNYSIIIRPYSRSFMFHFKTICIIALAFILNDAVLSVNIKINNAVLLSCIMVSSPLNVLHLHFCSLLLFSSTQCFFSCVVSRVCVCVCAFFCRFFEYGGVLMLISSDQRFHSIFSSFIWSSFGLMLLFRFSVTLLWCHWSCRSFTRALFICHPYHHGIGIGERLVAGKLKGYCCAH